MQVYKITNLVNGKVYVGRTTLTAASRWRRHLSAAHLGKGSPYLGAAIRKHGVEAFTVETIYEAKTNTELSAMEIFFIVLHQSNLRENVYNLTLGGEQGLLGYKHSEETKRKIAAGRQGMNHPMYGYKYSEEAKLKFSEMNKGEGNPFFGKSHTVKSRLKMGARGVDHHNFGKHLAESTRQKIGVANSKTSTFLSPSGSTVTITNMKAFCNKYGLSRFHMSAVSHGRRPHHRGWTGA